MPEHLPLPLKHLRFSAPPESFNYSGRGGGDFSVFLREDRSGHVEYLKRQVEAVSKIFEHVSEERQASDTSSEFGLILNVTSEPSHPLKYESLESSPRGNTPAICLLNLRHEDTAGGIVTKAAIFVPHGQLHILEKKISEYDDPTKDSKDSDGNYIEPRRPRNSPLLNNIHNIAVAAMDALWTDMERLPAPDVVNWFELWIKRDNIDWESQLRAECERLGVEIPDQTLTFPDHIVIIAQASRNQLESSLDLLNCLSEVRMARPCSVGLSDLGGIEQEEWIDDALTRIQWPNEDAPAVCILDTGVNRGHSLIEPLLQQEDMSTVFSDGDASDDTTLKHGTPMAGLAAFGDLRNLMLSSTTWEQLHRLESVKLIRHTSRHDPEHYGSITLQAINEMEIIAPTRPRVFCIAITTPGPNTLGNPSSWSTTLDIAASGAQTDDDQARVILVSTGNTEDEIHNATLDYPETLYNNPVEDPAQAWNVITVGAVTNSTIIEEDDDEALRSNAIAPNNGLSPYTRTSHTWRPDWPIAPDIVMEGGNLGKDQRDDILNFDSLHPLSTASNFTHRPITPFNATSAATALASRVAAQITQRYPDLRSETIRGMLVHSARWTQELLDLENIDPHRPGSTAQVKALMRSYGYGIVDEQRALNSLDNAATFFIENTIRPYDGTAGKASLNECHLINLPWPKYLLENNHDVTVTLRVTLSYYIQPNPGSRSWDNGQKYKYASHLLGFKPKHAGYSMAEFRSRLNADETPLARNLNDPGWAVGGQTRGKCGSLIQDIWKGSAADLASMEAIAVYPRAKGWWATRKYGADRIEHNCHLNSVPYSLIISIETEENLPIYSEVSNAIAEIEASIDVDA